MIKVFGFGKVNLIVSTFIEIIIHKLLVESDNEFECVSVLHGHSQDVKSVLWHPSQEVEFKFLIVSKILYILFTTRHYFHVVMMIQ